MLLPHRAQSVFMIVRFLGQVDYQSTVAAMRAFTAARDADTCDELWLCEHPPTFTQGLSGKPEHLLSPGDIPVVASDRGGQVSYHGPGQVTAYPLVDLRRINIFVKEYVARLELAIVETLSSFGVDGIRVSGAPGVYVHSNVSRDPKIAAGSRKLEEELQRVAKIAALGIKVSRHCTYHGLSLNVAMDLRPFEHINPCGYVGLRTTSLQEVGVATDWSTVAERLADRLLSQLVVSSRSDATPAPA
ncbi:lipoyl(octanoyl) transferase LipB [Tardibacter chloracetimidivorans]|mgnify:CR=1 FL=1|nr:lipoyl(octanoyl) transferase LipB [Tardibacter chloracetimidivorans]